MMLRISAPLSTSSRSHASSASSGMNSIQRTTYGLRRASSANASTSSSLKPRMATAFTLIGRRLGYFSHSSSPASTCGRASRRVMWANFSRTGVSMLTLIRRSPASTRSPHISFSRKPLVVRLRLFSPSMRDSFSISTGRSRRTVGSPPVRRTSSMPMRTKMRTSRSISS